MPTYPPSAADLFAGALAAEFTALYAQGRRILAVDARHGARFADRLGAALQSSGARVFRADLEDFQRPWLERDARGRTGEAVYFDRYDYAAFLRVLVEPFLLGGSASFVTAAFDAARDRQREPVWRTAAEDTVLLVSGPFLQRPELHGRFSFTVFLEEPCPLIEDGGPNSDWADAFDLYEAQAQPRRNANAVVDHSDPDRPRRVFRDSC